MRPAAVLFLAGTFIAACGQPQSGGGEILVSAASSLTDAFVDLEAAFESSNPELDVVLNLGASSLLREQLLGGAPVDVFAPADIEIMEAVAEAGLIRGDPEVFALSRLQIAVPVGNPGGISGLDDFARPGLLIGLCAEGVPCGDFARQAFEMAGVSPIIDTREPSVRALVVKLEAAELDAGITYATDVIASDGIEGLEIPDAVNVVVRYPVAIVRDGAGQEHAIDFISFVLSGPGREILASHGFDVP